MKKERGKERLFFLFNAPVLKLLKSEWKDHQSVPDLQDTFIICCVLLIQCF